MVVAPGWRIRAGIALGVLLAVAAVVGGWSAWHARWRSTRIVEVSRTSDPARFSLGLATCNAEHRLRVDEDRTSVRIFVEHRRGTRDDCADGLPLGLSAPLGDRRLLDGRSGRVLLDPAEECVPDLSPTHLPPGARPTDLDPYVAGLRTSTWLVGDGFLEVSVAVPPTTILEPLQEVSIDGVLGVAGHLVVDADRAVLVVSWPAQTACGSVRVAVASNALPLEELVLVARSL